MRFYHRTTGEKARAIGKAGFRDGKGAYLTETDHEGVWLSDRPLDFNEGVPGDVVLCLKLDETLAAPFEWIEVGKTYREFLIPARLLNSSGRIVGWSRDPQCILSPPRYVSGDRQPETL